MHCSVQIIGSLSFKKKAKKKLKLIEILECFATLEVVVGSRHPFYIFIANISLSKTAERNRSQALKC